MKWVLATLQILLTAFLTFAAMLSGEIGAVAIIMAFALTTLVTAIYLLRAKA